MLYMVYGFIPILNQISNPHYLFNLGPTLKVNYSGLLPVLAFPLWLRNLGKFLMQGDMSVKLTSLLEAGVCISHLQ